MKALLGIALLAAMAPAVQPEPPVVFGGARIKVERTMVSDAAALARLRRNSGITLQWISFEAPARGHVVVSQSGNFVHLSGSQRGGGGELRLEGNVLMIEARRFVFQGEISIVGTPDPGRNCLRNGTYEFLVTGRRRYWRLQQMQACDGLTDYVDIYY